MDRETNQQPDIAIRTHTNLTLRPKHIYSFCYALYKIHSSSLRQHITETLSLKLQFCF